MSCLEIPSSANGRLIETGFGGVRDFLGNQLVALTVSSRAGGLAVDVDLTPDGLCNLNCEYCDAAAGLKSSAPKFSLPVFETEFQRVLHLVESGMVKDLPRYGRLPAELIQLRQIAINGSGEPTLCTEFREAVETIIQVRASQRRFFKVVLYTNGLLLDSPPVQQGLQYFTPEDEIWIKLDVGIQAINQSPVSIEKILANITELGRRRPIVVQSLFPAINGQAPADELISQFISRLNDIKNAGARIETVQIYSATPNRQTPACGHLPLHSLRNISNRVRKETGLKTQVF